MEDFVKEILLTEQQIAEKVREMGAQISQDYAGQEVVVICVLKGAMPFTSDLIRRIQGVSIILETMVASSYGSRAESSGEVKIKLDCKTDIADKHVLLVDDITDTGITLQSLYDLLQQRQPKSLKCCAFLDKPSRRRVDFEADYVGYKIPDAFVIGYGLDYDNLYRALPYVAVIKEEYIHE